MGRPKDLPQPVREHPSHPLPLDGTGLASPGPAYEGYGVTIFDRDHRLGIFTSSRERARIPSARGPMQPAVATTPGPVYDAQDYNPNKTRLGTSFTRSGRFTDAGKLRARSSPGPGNYHDEEQHQSIVDRKHISSTIGTLPRSRRKPLNDEFNNNPSSAEYTPNIAPTRVHHGPISFPKASVKQRNAKRVAKCETSDASLAGPEEFHNAERWTRPSSCSVSIGKGSRFDRGLRPGSADIGPGQYDSVGADDRLSRHAPQISFPTGTRRYKNHLSYLEMDRDIASTGGGAGHCVLPSTLSQKGVRLSPKRNSSSSSNRNNINNSGISASPGSYNPDISLTRPNRNQGVSMGRAPRFARQTRSANSTNALDVSVPSSIDLQHGARIGTSKRFTLTAEQKECFTHPSSAEYDPKLPKRPESASRSIFGRHEKVGLLMKEAMTTPGPKYGSVDLNTMKESLVKQASFPKAKRGLLERRQDSTTPGVGSYDTTHDPMKKGGRSAILYLGA